MLGCFGAVLGIGAALALAWVINQLGLTWMPPGRIEPVPLAVRVAGEHGNDARQRGRARGRRGPVCHSSRGARVAHEHRGRVAPCLASTLPDQTGLRPVGLPPSSLWLGFAALAHAAPDAQAILAASDAVRNPSRPFAVTVTLLEYRNSKQTDGNTLTVYSKADNASGQYRSLIRFVAPQRDANKLMLKNGNDLWFYDPSSQASIRLSPQQRLLGQASNGDVVTVNLAKDYKAELLGEEDTGRRRARDAPRLQAGPGRRVARRHLPPRGDVGRHHLVAPDQGALLRRERAPAEDRLLPQVPAATGPRAADRGRHHRRARPGLGDRAALQRLRLARGARRLAAARLPAALQTGVSMRPTTPSPALVAWRFGHAACRRLAAADCAGVRRPDDLDALVAGRQGARADSAQPARPWRLFIEGAVGQGELRDTGSRLRHRSAARSTFASTPAWRRGCAPCSPIGSTWRHSDGVPPGENVNTLREAYLSWARTRRPDLRPRPRQRAQRRGDGLQPDRLVQGERVALDRLARPGRAAREPPGHGGAAGAAAVERRRR